MRAPRLLSILAIALCFPALGSAQGFTPAITVNGEAITGFELEQRRLLLEALSVPGDAAQNAEEGLIEDRLKMQAARNAGIQVTQDQLELGMEEFASRGNLSMAEFVTFLAESGVDPETFRDFVEAGLIWRNFVRGRFGPRATVSEAEIERALALSSTTSGARILLAEIILPTQTPEMAAQANTLAEDLQQRIRTTADFSAAAARFSVAGSRNDGGRRDWVSLSELPPQLASQLLTLAPGEVSDIIPLGQQAIGLFQVRALEERRAQAEGGISVEYATLALPADASEAAARAAELSGTVDSCDDLYPIVRGLPDGVFARQTVPSGSLSSSVSSALALLDANESTVLTTSAGAQFLMLCSRASAVTEEEGGIEQIRNQLRNQRLSSYADSYLEELRADASIVR